jgi:hypothetical protein
MLVDNFDYTRLQDWCLKFGYKIGMRRHPKTRANWYKPSQKHDKKNK